ncbi:amidohydrolase family protein [Echinicola shivajiensis]|uniref:amidohydrolase family protein n=1 Tax=Echinicola shivajiensis TaxID=1035916 RepID=UPI001FE380AB|nr:amidohydrolase family protein [Echinicola shivajiensis]
MIKRQNTLKLLMVWLCLLFGQAVYSQSDYTGKKRVTGTYAITNATIITSPGKTINNGTVIIKDGLFESISSNAQVPVDAQIIPGDSLIIYPGFIDALGEQGVSAPDEVKKPEGMDPSNPPNDVAGITPELEVLQYWEIGDNGVEDWRKNGFSISQVAPKGLMLPGKTALVVFGDEKSSNYLSTASGLYAQFKTARGVYPGTTLGLMAKWRELYKNAELKQQHSKMFASQGNGLARPQNDLSLEAFYPVINQEIPVIFKTKDELEIRRALKLQNELGFKLVLAGIEDGSSLADDIKAAGASVILSLDLPDPKASQAELEDATEEAKKAQQRVVEAYNNALMQAANFEKAGIPFAFSTLDAKSGEFMKHLRLMVENGLSEEAALAALTVNAAEILGISQFTGSIAEGNLANLVITTDKLTDEMVKIKYVFADGYLFEYEGGKSNVDMSKAKELVGNWNYESETPGGTSKGTVKYEVSSGELQGEIVVDDPDGGGQITRKLKDINYDGKELSFNFSVMAQGNKLIVHAKGIVMDNKFEGTLSIKDMGKYSLKATKVPEFKL